MCRGTFEKYPSKQGDDRLYMSYAKNPYKENKMKDKQSTSNEKTLSRPELGSKWTIPCKNQYEGKVLKVERYGWSYEEHPLVLLSVDGEPDLYSVGLSTFDRVAMPWRPRKVWSIRELVALDPCLDGLMLLCYAAGLISGKEVMDIRGNISISLTKETGQLKEANARIRLMKKMLKDPESMDAQWSFEQLAYKVHGVTDHRRVREYLLWVLDKTIPNHGLSRYSTFEEILAELSVM